MNKKYIQEKIKDLKKGVFISEIIIAIVIFSFVIGTSYFITRNNVSKEVSAIANSNAGIECVKNIEKALSKSYDELNSFNTLTEIDGIKYNTSVDVRKYSDEDFTKKDYIKIINCKCEYFLNGELKEYNISTIKKREI